MNALDAHARAHDARRLARDLLDADAATRAMSVASRSDASGTPPPTSARAASAALDGEDDDARRAREACATFIALGLLDAEDAFRDGKRRRATMNGGDLTAVLEASGTTLVRLLDALPEFLNASARALATKLPSPGSSAVAEVERTLQIREIRSAFAFNKVIANKFRDFARLHFDDESPGGKAIVRLGWSAYLCVKCEALPTFPDLYSCFHLLVAVEAFLLVNAPRALLRTSLRNMMTMSTKDPVTGLPDPLASLSAMNKTKIEIARQMSEAIVKVMTETFPNAKKDSGAHFDDVAPCDSRVTGVFDGDKDVAERVIERYKRVSSETFGRLAVDETLYLYTEMDVEGSRGRRVIGDLAECATASTRGAMATPARRNKRTAPFSPIRPKKIPLVVGPASPARPFRGIAVAGPGPAATPISQAMATASWLQDVVCAESVEAKLVNLRRYVRQGDAETLLRLRRRVEVLGGRVGQAIREDALTTGARVDVGPQSAVMDALVEQRTEEVTHVFFHFLIRILNDERAKMSGDERDADFTSLLASERFTKCLLACAMEVVVTTYKTSTLAFPATTQLLGIHPFDLVTIIESFVRADAEAPREIQRHFHAVEEKTLERLAWCKGSSLFEFLRTFHESGETTSVDDDEDGDGAGPSTSDAPARVSTPALDVFAVAAAAAAAGGAARRPNEETCMPQCHSPVRRTPTSAFTAFSSPLRGSTTPRRRPTTAARLPANFAPVRDHDVERPPGRDLCAFKALRIFFGKVMHLAARRLSDLASRLRLSPELARDAYAIVEHVVYEHTSLAYNRHVDQIVLASVYGACKVSSDDGVSPTSTSCASLQFKDIIYQYSKQPHAREEIFWTVTLEQTDPELDVVSRGDIISFYNQVFVGRVKTFLLTLRERREREKSTGARDGDENFVVPPSPRRRLPIANQRIYVSPMRPERVSSVLNHDGVPATPRTKSLFATIGETAYASSNDAFEAINRELHAATGSKSAATGRAASRFAAGASRSKIPNFGDHNR